MRKYAERGDKGLAPFPTTHDAYQIADHLPVLAAVVFSTMINWGKAVPGSVSDNIKDPGVSKLRDSVENVAFPDAGDLERLRQLRERLKKGRDKMIAHADGSAFNLTLGGPMTTLWPISAAVDHADIELWRSCIGPLSESLTAHEWLLRGGEAAELALGWPIMSGNTSKSI